MKYKKGSFITVPNTEELKGLHPTAQCLFMWLCYHANQNGECFPSRKRLSILCRVSVDMVDKMLKILIGSKIVIKEKRKKNEKQNKTNLYHIIIGGVADTNGYLADTNGEGVADRNGSELNSSFLTKSTEEENLKQKTEYFIIGLKHELKGMSFKKSEIEELKAFVSYWTEPNKSRTKLKWELEKTWDTHRRLGRWFKNKKDWGKNTNSNKYQISDNDL